MQSFFTGVFPLYTGDGSLILGEVEQALRGGDGDLGLGKMGEKIRGEQS